MTLDLYRAISIQRNNGCGGRLAKNMFWWGRFAQGMLYFSYLTLVPEKLLAAVR